HSYMKMLYKYPQAEYPYDHLIEENRTASKTQDEFELIDTGIFDEDRYFDIFIEYAKNDDEDIVSIVTVHNRGPEAAKLTLMPTVWFRKTWFTGHEPFMPKLTKLDEHSIKAFNPKYGNYIFTFCSNTDLVFCDNETNREKLYVIPNERKYTKYAINDCIGSGDRSRLNPLHAGTKAAAIYELEIPAGGQSSIKRRMQHQVEEQPLDSCEVSMELRKKEADEFYE